MSGSRSPSPVLFSGSISARPASSHWWSWFKKNVYENSCEANAIFWGTATWVLVYYLRDSFRNIDEDNETVGYALHNVAMGVLSNAVTALIALLKSRLENGAFSWAALKEALAYVLIYLPLDGSYQAIEDYVIAINRSNSFDATNFEKYADVTLERNEVFAALAFYGVGYSGINYLMNKIMHKPASMPKSFLVGAQYVTFFGTDYCFNVELSPSVPRGLLGLVYSSGTVALTALATNVAYDALETSCCPQQQSSVEIEVVEEKLDNDYVKLNDDQKEQPTAESENVAPSSEMLNHPDTVVDIEDRQSPQASLMPHPHNILKNPTAWARFKTNVSSLSFPFWSRKSNASVDVHATAINYSNINNA